MSKRRIVLGIVTALAGLAAVGIVAANPVHHAEVHTQSWSFNGFFGSFDQAQLKRGHVIYKDVCSGCHAMSLLAYRDLQDIGYTEDEVKAFAAEVQVGVRASRPPVRSLQGAVPQRAGGARGQQRRSAARSVADGQGARRRRLPRL
jgi:cytochrome c1